MNDAPRAVVVTVGEELLLGETVDTNAAWLGRTLAGLGFEVVERHTVGDDDAAIRGSVRRALEAADLVVVTGGLGPTSDDRTRPAVARELDRPLRTDPEMLDALRERFVRRGFAEMPPSNASQAEVPDGAEVLPNPRGTAPGLLLDVAASGERGERVVVLLPGVPGEMKGIVSEELAPRLRQRFSDRLRPLHHRVIRTTGVAESDLAGRVDEALGDDDGPVSVAFLPDVTGVDLRLTVHGAVDGEEAVRALDDVESRIAEVVRPWRYEAEQTGDLVETVSRALADRGLVLATAESCTGGLIAKRMTDRPGSSSVFVGGVVAYADEAKVGLLGVPRDVLERDGAVSEAVARSMAEGAMRAFGAGCGIGVTGVAGPGGGTETKPVGLVFYAAAVEGRVEVRRYVFTGDRDSVRLRSAQAALALLARMLRGESPGTHP